MELSGKNIVVAGLGKTGEALVHFLVRKDATVTITDQQLEARLSGAINRLGELPVKKEFGGFRAETFTAADMIILSPGVPHTLSQVEEARTAGVPVVGEIELAYRFIEAPIIAVTGTNGKSTTTRLIGSMLSASGLDVFVGGNIGTPLIVCADEYKNADVVVAEISSFQLDTITDFRPTVGVLLNITADHLDRYSDFTSYGESKGRIFKNQRTGDTAVVNAADPMVTTVSESIASRRCGFNVNDSSACGAVIDETGIYLSMPECGEIRIDAGEMAMIGRHNLENAAAAALAAFSAGATEAGVREALATFLPDPHRMEYVAAVNGVGYYDDSKATNTDAVVRAIEALGSPIILIAGGRDKGGGYESLREPVRKSVKELIVLGEAADNIISDLGDLVSTQRADSMSEAVEIAAGIAVSGDKVLLSPACSSFDMYTSYAQRGDDYQRSVKTLQEAER